VSPDDICPTCEDALCSCRQPIAIIGCYDCKAVVQYVVFNGTEWWTGVALTNRNDSVNSCVMALVTPTKTYTTKLNIPANKVISKTIGQFFPEVVTSHDTLGYIEILSVNRLEALCIMGSNSGIYALPALNCCSCTK
jgi:hypothetical protein